MSTERATEVTERLKRHVTLGRCLAGLDLLAMPEVKRVVTFWNESDWEIALFGTAAAAQDFAIAKLGAGIVEVWIYEPGRGLDGLTKGIVTELGVAREPAGEH